MTRKCARVPTDPTELVEWLDAIVLRFQGSVDELESAIGMLLVGRHLGWKVLRLVHTARTIEKYEAILGVGIREVFPPEGPGASRSAGMRAAREVSNYWKVVSGDLDVGLDRAGRRRIDL